MHEEGFLFDFCFSDELDALANHLVFQGFHHSVHYLNAHVVYSLREIIFDIESSHVEDSLCFQSCEYFRLIVTAVASSKEKPVKDLGGVRSLVIIDVIERNVRSFADRAGH